MLTGAAKHILAQFRFAVALSFN